MFKEFKEFAVKGNVMDLAIGVIVGGAFGKVVTSLVNDLIMPPLGFLMGKVDFVNLYINLSSTPYANLTDAKAAGAATLNYGLFLNTVLDFLIVAFVMFLVVKKMNKLKRKPSASEPNTKTCPFCFSTISKQATKCAFCTSALS